MSDIKNASSSAWLAFSLGSQWVWYLEDKSFSEILSLDHFSALLNSSKVFKLLAKTGILVRKMDVYGIKNSLRITIGKSEENKKLISKMKKILNV